MAGRARARRGAALGLVLLALGVLVSSCGGSSGSSGSSTKDWANGLCTAITTWTDSIKKTGNSLRNGNISKSSLQQASKDFGDSTKKLADDLKGLGKPDTDAGQQAADKVDKLAGQIQSDADQIKSAVNGASSLTEVQKALTSVASTLTQMGSQISTTFSEISNLDAKGELEKAFKSAPACSSLVNSSG
jgi:methyl-accepting chemotaxis protein